MTSRERVLRCVTFAGPDRVPMSLPAPFPNDFCMAGETEDPNWKPYRTWEMEDGAQWEDEWHNVWRRLSNTTRGEVVEGALKDWADLETYEFPRFELPERFVRAAETFGANPDRYHIGSLPGFPFAIMRYLRKIEVFLADVLLYPDEVIRLQERIVVMLEQCMDQWKAAGADGVMFAEDWGTQERLLVSPRLWEEMFRPGFEALVGHARAQGLHVWMHSCGYIKEIIPSLRDIGVTVLQLDQPELSGIDWLRETVGGRVTIWSPVDIQRKLPTGNRDLIRAAAREMIEKLGRGGGFVAGHYSDVRSLAVEPEWQQWADEAFVEYAGLARSAPVA